MSKKERLVRRASEAQRQQGKLPEVSAIDSEFSQRLERIDRKRAEAPAAGKGGAGASPITVRERADAMLRERGAQALSEHEASRYERRRTALRKRSRSPMEPFVRRRVKLLVRKPDWRRRLMDAWDEGAREAFRLGIHPGSSKAKKIQATLVERVLDASSAVFGDWRKPPPTRITSSGTGGQQTGSRIVLP